jgi:hypothetical protein
VGYPRLFNGRQCNLLARISSGEQAALNHTADLLAATTGARAAAHGSTFVDARGAFSGHAVRQDQRDKGGRRLIYGCAECLADDRPVTHHTLTCARMG